MGLEFLSTGWLYAMPAFVGGLVLRIQLTGRHGEYGGRQADHGDRIETKQTPANHFACALFNVEINTGHCCSLTPTKKIATGGRIRQNLSKIKPACSAGM